MNILEKNSIQKILNELNVKQISELPPIFVECGDDDYLLDGNIEVAQILIKKGRSLSLESTMVHIQQIIER